MTIRELVDLFGGPSATARLCSLHRSAVSQWLRRGYIPPAHHLILYKAAEARGVNVPDAFFIEHRGPK